MMEHIDFETILFNREIYEINLLDARSTYKTYLSEEDYLDKKTNEILFNDGWKLNAISAYSQVNAFLEQTFAEKDISSYPDIIVPLSLELQGFDKPAYINSQYPFDGYKKIKLGEKITLDNPANVYLKRFDMDWDKNEKVIINFKGFETALFLYLNGEFVGYSENLYLDNEFDITPFLRKKGNIIAAIVFKYSSSSYILSQDIYRFSGIFRDITIKKERLRSVYDIDVKYHVDFKENNVKGDIILTPESSSLKKTIEIKDEESIVFVETSLADSISFTISHPHLWNAEKPYLYDLILKTYDGDILLDIKTLKIGFRNIEIDSKHVLLFNKKRLKIKGINRNEWDMERGRAISKDIIDFDLKLLKENNVNAIRTSHYPNQEYFYELADELGFYVMDEACLESHASFQTPNGCFNEFSIPGNDKGWEKLCLSRVMRMYERDKNHPSVFMFSLGNESGSGAVFVSLHDALKKRDPKILIHYEGVHLDRTYNLASDVQSEMYTRPNDVKKHLDEFNNKPFLLCEFAHSMGNSFGNVDEYMQLFSYNEHYVGGFIWDYIDLALFAQNERGEKALCYGGDFLERPNDKEFCADGIIFADRKLIQKSSKLVAMKYCYQPIRFQINEDEISITNDYLFTDTSDLAFEIYLLEDGKIINEKTISLNIAPQEEKTIAMPFSFSKNAKFDNTVQMFCKNDDKTIASEESIFPCDRKRVQLSKKPYEIVVGNYNIGVVGENFSYLFSLANCASHLPGLVSLSYQGEEFLENEVLPTIFRPNTNNDIGNRFKIDSGLALLYSKNLFINNEDIQNGKTNEGLFWISFEYRLSPLEKEKIKIKYTVLENGSLLVEESMKELNLINNLPYFGIRFPIPKLKKKIRYFALGTNENYPDRVGGSLSKIVSSDVENEFMPYLFPQEYGNHEKTRFVDILGEKGILHFEMEKRYLSFKYLKNTEFEIENAAHVEELPNSIANYLEIASRTRGVGGDDTWGSPVHSDYEIRDKEYNLIFSLSFER